jgi:glycosyltransferase involved in cell wall biosynthesis
MDDYYKLFASCDVCIAPSRWEGLGLHLYEAIAFGLPIITNDDPPMNELVRDGYNGKLVASRTIGQTPSGIASREPDVNSLAHAIAQLSDTRIRESMSRNASEMARHQLNWNHTTSAFATMIHELHPALENAR